MIDTDRLRAIKAFLADVTAGPWQWFGNTKFSDVYLATVHSGRRFVMGFERWGMRGAQPVFQVEISGREGGGYMRSLKELSEGGGGLGAKFEVPYRRDFVGIGHADARFIAESRLRAAWERVGAVLEAEGCDCDHDHYPDDPVTDECGLGRRVEAAWNGKLVPAAAPEVELDDGNECACAMGHVPDEAREELEECRRLGRPCPWCGGRVAA